MNSATKCTLVLALRSLVIMQRPCKPFQGQVGVSAPVYSKPSGSMYLIGEYWASKYFLYRDSGAQVYDIEAHGLLGKSRVPTESHYRVWPR